MAEPDKEGAEDIRIVQFFDKLHEQLWAMPWSECTRINRELSLHLEEIVDARLAAGTEKDEAVSYALTQLGDPSDLGKRLRKEWCLSGGSSVGVGVRAIAEAYAWSLLILAPVLLATAKFQSVHPRVFDIPGFFMQIAAHILTGAIVGARRPGEAVASVIQAAIGLYLMEVLVFLILSNWPSTLPQARAGITAIWASVVFGNMPNLAWIALCTAVPAYFMSAWRLGGFYRISTDDFRLRGRMASH